MPNPTFPEPGPDGNPVDMVLLLQLLESRRLVFTMSALRNFCRAAQPLVERCMLIPDGYDTTIVDDEDEDCTAFDIGPHPHREGLGYFHPVRGWVDVNQTQLQRWRPDLTAIFTALLGKELRLPVQGLLERETGLIWEIGSVRLIKSGRTTIWFVRCLHDLATQHRLQEALRKFPPLDTVLALTSTEYEDGPHMGLGRCVIVPIADVLDAYAPQRIDFDRLRRRFEGRHHIADTGPLTLSQDGRTLTISGVEMVFGGEAQQHAIRQLVDAYHDHRGLRAAAVLENAGTSVTSFAQLFKKQWPVLRRYLKSQNGFWHLEP
ncbi:hypothetical protein [Mesorhizobium sp. CN2-181]|uniref:hypothetical protein n=1 Tax=Mesorhizobium yinganensis TaxID=3157707 RepID=UPI0032B74A05